MERPKKIRCKYCFPAILCVECKKYNQAYDVWERYHEQEKKRLEEINKELLEACKRFVSNISDMTADAYRKEIQQIKQAIAKS